MKKNSKMSEIEEISISFPPHHNTLTSSGKSHFSRIADGLAEFVDNSIQACEKESTARNIEVSFFLNSYQDRKTGYIAISDNGSGMTEEAIKEFATFSLDKVTKGFTKDDIRQSSIGKFGVGAKQAGFYFGDRVRVVTKCNDNPKVMEFTLDRDEFQRKSNNKTDVYSGFIKVRSVGDRSTVPGDEEMVGVLQEALIEHEEKYENFTIIVIKMHPEMVRRMIDGNRYENLPQELAEIYHFHLHPEHLPKEITKTFKDVTGRLVMIRFRVIMVDYDVTERLVTKFDLR
jgi:hypothetical protein